jgi:hypothetical protein
MDGTTQRQPVKFTELLATAAPPTGLVSWYLLHREMLHSAIQDYTLLVSAIGTTFAALYWVRRWFKHRKEKTS